MKDSNQFMWMVMFIIYLQVAILFAVTAGIIALRKHLERMEKRLKDSRVHVIFSDRDPIEIDAQEKASNLMKKVKATK